MKQLYPLIIVFCFSNSCFCQVVINELFPDPNPAVSLPEAEFIEILNTSEQPVSMLNWSVTDATATAIIQEEVVLEPNDYLILCDVDDVNLFVEYGPVIGIAGFPTLNNNEDVLSIFTDAGEAVDEVSYSSGWYNDALKEDGGWTIERINPFASCSSEANWSASINELGGTPGTENSIIDETFIDDSPMFLLSAWLNDEDALEIEFSKQPDEEGARSETSYRTDPNLVIDDISLSASGNIVVLSFETAIRNEQVYEIEIAGLSDCNGTARIDTTAVFGRPEQIEVQDIILNEILFNPTSGGVDFVELRNRSEKLVTIDGISILELNPVTPSVIDDFVTIENTRRYIAPNQLITLSSNPESTIAQYDVETPGNLLHSSIPNYPDEQGIIAILNQRLDTVDKFHYYEDWHFEGLSDYNGVSLERLDADAPTQQKSNWFSASFTVGFATPTAENSQNPSVRTAADERLHLSHEVFTPDNDGMNDFLEILLQVEEQGTTATIAVYNIHGSSVKTIVNNQLISEQSSFRWDGLDENGQQLPLGHYIIVAEYYDAGGNQSILKKKVVLSRRF